MHLLVQLQHRTVEEALVVLELAEPSGNGKLRNLTLRGRRVGDELMAYVAKLSDLQSVALSFTEVTESGIAHLGNLQDLQSLSLEPIREPQTPPKNASFIQAPTTPKRWIQIAKAQQRSMPLGTIEDGLLQSVARLKNLEVLKLHGCVLSDSFANYLKQLPRLETLSLRFSNFSAHSLRELSNFKSLTQLSFLGSHLTDAGVEHLGTLLTLESLELAGTDVTDNALNHLMKLSRLRYLGIQDTEVTDEGADLIRQALPECRILSGLSVSIEDEQFPK